MRDMAGPLDIDGALGDKTSFGINLAALSLPVEPGSRVIASDREFPANVYPLSSGHRSAILAFRAPNPAAVHEALRARGVVCALRESAIRVAPHLYNTHDDIERVVTVLSRTVSG
jgi:selenocysteine lyase/cysteine desulfurase